MRTLLAPLLLLCLLVAYPAAAQEAPINPDPQDEGGHEKRAQAGMKFLTVSTDPRAAALGNAATALEFGAASTFYNPAGMARMDGVVDISIGRASYIADIVYNQGAIAFSPAGGRFGVVAVSVMSVDYGELEGTIRADNTQGYIETDLFEPTALTVGLGYAKALTDRFAVGGNVKYVREDLGSSVMSLSDPEDFTSSQEMQGNALATAAFDFGVIYRTGFRSLTFAMMARNFSPAVEYEEESFELPLTLSVGASMDLMDLRPSLSGNHSLLLSVSGATPRDYYEQVSVGAEYVFMGTISLRAGYVSPSDEEGLSLGGGLRVGVGDLSFRADYSYSEFGVFGEVNRLAFKIGL